jgi:hypothetical protein
MWKSLSRLWTAIRHVLSVRSLLEAIGLWGTVVAGLICVAVGIGSFLKRQAWPVAVTLGLLAFGAVALIWGIVRRHRGPRTFKPSLAYENIDGEGYFRIGEEMYYLQLMNIRNTQCAVETTANSVVARLEYHHASGDKFVAQEALWLTAGKKGAKLIHAVFLGSNAVGRMVFLGKTKEGDLVGLLGVQTRKLQPGKWTIKVSITGDNCDPLIGQIGFTWLPEKRLVYTTPAFRY